MIVDGLTSFWAGLLAGLVRTGSRAGFLWRVGMAAWLARLELGRRGKDWLNNLWEGHRQRAAAAVRSVCCLTTARASV